MKLRTVPGDYPFVSQSSGSKATVVPGLQSLQARAQIRFPCQAPGDISAGNQVIDVAQQALHARINFIEVGDNRDAGSFSPSGGLDRRSRVMTVDMQSPRLDDPLLLKFLGPQR